MLVTATNYSHLCVEGKALLEANDCTVFENTFGRPMTFEELSERVAEVDAVVAGVDRWPSRCCPGAAAAEALSV